MFSLTIINCIVTTRTHNIISGHNSNIKNIVYRNIINVGQLQSSFLTQPSYKK